MPLAFPVHWAFVLRLCCRALAGGALWRGGPGGRAAADGPSRARPAVAGLGVSFPFLQSTGGDRREGLPWSPERSLGLLALPLLALGAPCGPGQGSGVHAGQAWNTKLACLLVTVLRRVGGFFEAYQE